MLSPKDQKIFDSLIALGCTEEEALQTLEDDKKIDKGEKLFELDPTLKRVAKRLDEHREKPTPLPPREREKVTMTRDF